MYPGRSGDESTVAEEKGEKKEVKRDDASISVRWQHDVFGVEGENSRVFTNGGFRPERLRLRKSKRP